jgi:hypothetical protein
MKARGKLGAVLLIVGVVCVAAGEMLFPGSTAECSGVTCAITVPTLATYASQALGATLIVMGAVLVYMDARPRFDTFTP